MKTTKKLAASILTALTLILASFVTMAPSHCSAGEWIVDGDTQTFIDNVGYSSDGSVFSGTVALQMKNVIDSGKLKIVTTILSIVPQPSFTYSVKKSGGVNGTVEIVFSSATCESRFSFLYKPGSTRIDYSVMNCR